VKLTDAFLTIWCEL